jgi:hypothetical protein
VHGTGRDDLWAVGDFGTLVHNDGVGWRGFDLGVAERLNGVWAAAADDVWAVGLDGVVLHYDGEAWSRREVDFNEGAGGAGPTTAFSRDLTAVTVSDSGRVWATGTNSLLEFDGERWTDHVIPKSAVYYGVAARGDKAWAVGSAGVIASFDGTKWTQQVSNTPNHIYDVAARSDDDVWAVGHKVVLHWNGKAWSNVTPAVDPAPVLRSLAVSADHVWAFGDGGAAWKYANGEWTALTSPTADVLLAAYSPGEDQVLVAGDAGRVVYWDGERRYDESPGPRENLLAVSGKDGAAWAVGDAFLAFDGELWTETPSTEVRSLYDVWLTDDTKGWAVGTGGRVLELSFGSWQEGAIDVTTWLHGVWSDGDRANWIVGDKGLIYQLAIDLWVPHAASGKVTTADLLDVWGVGEQAVWAVGANGTRLFHNGRLWLPAKPLASGAVVTSELRGVHGSSSKDVWVVGAGGTIIHFDGDGWDLLQSEEKYSLNAVVACSESSAFAVGTTGTVLAWDGKAWKPQRSGTGNDLHSVWCDEDGTAWAVGERGTLMYKRAAP